MFRIIVSFLVIVTSLWSQDLLVDSIEREFSGTLIKITDTVIYFRIQGETEAVQYPFWSVQRVTLADGRLAFEDGNIYVANPTVTAGPKLAEPTPSVAKSMAPQPMEMGPEVEMPTPLQLDPVTGARGPDEPAAMRDPHVYAATSPVLTAQQVSSLALVEAQRHHNGSAWAAGGGLLSCGTMFMGGVLGVSLLDSFTGFVIGAGVGAAAGAEMLATSVTKVPLPLELEAATPDLQETYRQAYASQTRALRRYSIYSGVLGLTAAAGIGLLVIILPLVSGF